MVAAVRWRCCVTYPTSAIIVGPKFQWNSCSASASFCDAALWAMMWLDGGGGGATVWLSSFSCQLLQHQGSSETDRRKDADVSAAS